jgi:hypothetical protein
LRAQRDLPAGAALALFALGAVLHDHLIVSFGATSGNVMAITAPNTNSPHL